MLMNILKSTVFVVLCTLATAIYLCYENKLINLLSKKSESQEILTPLRILSLLILVALIVLIYYLIKVLLKYRSYITNSKKEIIDLNETIDELRLKPDLRSIYGMNWTENGDPYCNVFGCFTRSPRRQEGDNDSFKCPVHGFIYGTDPKTKEGVGANTLLKLMKSVDMEKEFQKSK